MDVKYKLTFDSKYPDDFEWYWTDLSGYTLHWSFNFYSIRHTVRLWLKCVSGCVHERGGWLVICVCWTWICASQQMWISYSKKDISEFFCRIAKHGRIRITVKEVIVWHFWKNGTSQSKKSHHMIKPNHPEVTLFIWGFKFLVVESVLDCFDGWTDWNL
jgi:hypothetical protein